MPSRQGTASKTRPLADSTLPVDLPADLFVTLANAAGMPGPEKLTFILADLRARWLAGSAVATERYLELLPDLAGDPAARLALIRGELRRGKRPDWARPWWSTSGGSPT